MSHLLQPARRLGASAIVFAALLGGTTALFSQQRDFSAERIILDDDAGDGTRNTLTIGVPAGGLSTDRTLTFPDTNGMLITTAPTGLVAEQLLFGGPTGVAQQSGNLFWVDSVSLLWVNGTIHATTQYNIRANERVLSVRGDSNVFLGINAGGAVNDSGYQNVFVGHGAGQSNTWRNNTFVGAQAGMNNNEGGSNTFLGVNSGVANVSGNDNVFVGAEAGAGTTSGSENTYMGWIAGKDNVNGSRNTVLGYAAGQGVPNGQENTYLGSVATGAAGIQNATAIGTRAQVTQSNSLVLGSINGVNGSPTDVNVGIGTTAPSQKLEVANGNVLLSNTGTAGQLRFAEPAGSNYTALSAGAQSTDIIYTLPAAAPAADGDILTSTTAGVMSWSDPSVITITSVTGTADQVLVNGTSGTAETGDVTLTLPQDIAATSTPTFGGLTLNGDLDMNQNDAVDLGNVQFSTAASQIDNTAGDVTVADNLVVTGTIQSGSSIIINGTIPGSHSISTTGSEDLTIAPGGGDLNVTGTVNASGQYNIGGSQVLDVTGTDNLWVGLGAGAANTTGSENTGLGTNALMANTTGVNNTAVGFNALASITNATENTAVGANALAANQTSQNTAIGWSALTANTFGSGNTALGHRSLATNTSGNFNTAVGNQAMRDNTSGGFSTAVGYQALRTNTTGGANTAVGQFSMLENTTGSGNVAFGTDALRNNIDGDGNTAIGRSAMFGSSNGDDNTVVGLDALHDNTTGSSNTVVGRVAMSANTTGNTNVAIGLAALNINTTGSDNTVVGANAGITNTTGSNNTFIGEGADASAAALTNATAIGSGAIVGQSNAIVLGNGADIGIGTSTPGARLDVNGTVNVAGASTFGGAIDVDDVSGGNVTTITEDGIARSVNGNIAINTGAAANNSTVTTNGLLSVTGTNRAVSSLGDGIHAGRDNSSNAGIELVTAAGTPYIDFTRNAGAIDFDARLILTSDTELLLEGASLNLDGNDLTDAGTVQIGGATAVTNSRLIVDDGHWTSQQTTAPTAGGAGANVSSVTLANETDVAGSIDITSSATPAAGAQATVTFNAAYNTAPIVHLTAVNGEAAGIGAYVTSTTTGFTVNFIGVPAVSTSHQFNYLVIETQ